MGKVSDVIWHALAVLVLCALAFVRGCVRAVQMG